MIVIHCSMASISETFTSWQRWTDVQQVTQYQNCPTVVGVRLGRKVETSFQQQRVEMFNIAMDKFSDFIHDTANDMKL